MSFSLYRYTPEDEEVFETERQVTLGDIAVFVVVTLFAIMLAAQIIRVWV